jgi:hypothetical protein
MVQTSKYVFQPFISHIRVLSKRIKREYGSENVFQPFISHIRVLSKRIKRGYGPKYIFQSFISHIRVLIWLTNELYMTSERMTNELIFALKVM